MSAARGSVTAAVAAPSEGSESDPDDFHVVGVGASAGGLESLERFFRRLPAYPGMAFVVVQHLSPDFRSMMSELLSRHSNMPVHVAEHGVEVEPNRVYLLPPRKEIRIENGHLQLADKDVTHALTLPIDLFFRSLAADLGKRAVAIVLSGSGSDGSRGVQEVKRAGGLVLAESQETAKFDGMPLSALATGVVDYSAGAEALAAFLIGERDAEEPGPVQITPDPGELPIETVLRVLRSQFGLDFALYKRSTVARRILRRVSMRELPGVEEYLEQLRDDPEELGALYHDLLIGVTHFFRDPEAFDVLERRVIPEILERVPEGEEIRVWVAGCATGEEAYSLAMLLFEQLSALGRQMNFKVLATDVHRASLDKASAGFYAEAQLDHVSPARRERFFTKHPGGFQISQDLRHRIVFAPHDVTQNAPFTKMHLISCRNFLIYLEPPAQKTVLSLFHFGLASHGILFLGSSETMGAFGDEFVAIDEHWKIYRKRRDVRLLDPLRLPVARKTLGASAQLLSAARPASSDPQLLQIYDRLLDRFMPPSFLVDEARNLIESFSGAEQYLRFARRRPSNNLLDLLDGDLRTVAAGAIQRALATNGPVRCGGVSLPGNDGQKATLSAQLLTTGHVGQRHVLLSVEPEPQPELESGRDGANASALEEDRLSMLEAELAYTRESLRAGVEEQQTSNEELQATNEELIASNEELQSTNEELHSVNEELYTVNGEHQKKILELRELNNDIQHLLEGVDVGTLFLDGELQIRKYTPRVASVFHIRPSDVGRNIRELSHDLDRPQIHQELERALVAGEVVEDEVKDCHDTTYFLRILPYRPAANGEDEDYDVPPQTRGRSGRQVDGVMLSLTDISALDHARERVQQLSAIVESSDDAIIGKDMDGVIKSWNRGAERLYGYSAAEAIGQNIRMLAPPGYEEQVAEFMSALARGERIEGAETMRVCKDGTQLDISVTISPMHDKQGNVVGASAIARDITPLKRAQRELEEREARIRLLLDSTAEAIFGLGPDGVCTFCNPACVRLLGYSSVDDLIGQRIHALVHHSHADGASYAEDDCPIYSVLRTGEGTHSDTEVLFRADGTWFPAEYFSYPVQHNGRVDGAVVTFLDITQRKQADEELRLAAQRRERFLAMLSHELRNPLAALSNAINVVKHSDSPETSQRALDVIMRQSSHMSRLLDDLLDVSRITRGGIDLRKQDVDLRSPIELAAEAVAPLFEARGIELECQLPEEPLLVRGDPARLQQVVGNLLTNAARYSTGGRRVVLNAKSDGDCVVLRVLDHGRGIARELLTQIFELFVQAEQGLDRSEGGLGVGLALVKQLVELHGGSVQAESRGLNQGSEFVVRLPRLARRALEKRRDQSSDAHGARRIVVVEDHDDAREMLSEILRRRGYTVYQAKDGEDAVETIERVHPDLAIVDIGLPRLDGYGVARRLRTNPALNDVILVAFTGYGTRDDIQAASAAGFNDHLTKPADAKRIEEVLARVK